MPPFYPADTKRAIMAAAPILAKRDLTVNHTQSVTLGVMAAYVVVIALLWNLPYIRWSLWPFKVLPSCPLPPSQPTDKNKDASNRLPRIRPRHHLLLHRRKSQVHLPRPARRRCHQNARRNERYHPARRIPGIVANRGVVDILRFQYRREQGGEYCAGCLLPAYAVVGQEGLVDDRDGFVGRGIVGCLLVYWAWGGVEMGCGKFPV